jgi:hypothetical protein
MIMNRDDLLAYFGPAAVNLFGREALTPEDPNEWIEAKLDRALGVRLWGEYQERPINHDFPLTEEWRDLLRQLAGPNGHFILKMYQIKKGLEHAE